MSDRPESAQEIGTLRVQVAVDGVEQTAKLGGKQLTNRRFTATENKKQQSSTSQPVNVSRNNR